MAAEPLRLFIIGAQRSGTTLLHHALQGHPDVAMNEPVRPEPKHFLAEGSEETDPDDYDHRWFTDVTAPVRGEKSTTYLERPDAGERIIRCFPSARFVAVVRDPVERALSNYRLSRQQGLEPLTAAEALTEEAERREWDPGRTSASPYAYLRRGQYAEQLDQWAAVVGRDRLLVMRFEDLTSGDAVDDVLAFLDLRPHPAVTVENVVNASHVDASEPDLDQVRRRLAAYFEPWNRRLQRDWGVVTAAWGSGPIPGDGSR